MSLETVTPPPALGPELVTGVEEEDPEKREKRDKRRRLFLLLLFLLSGALSLRWPGLIVVSGFFLFLLCIDPYLNTRKGWLLGLLAFFGNRKGRLALLLAFLMLFPLAIWQMLKMKSGMPERVEGEELLGRSRLSDIRSGMLLKQGDQPGAKPLLSPGQSSMSLLARESLDDLSAKKLDIPRLGDGFTLSSWETSRFVSMAAPFLGRLLDKDPLAEKRMLAGILDAKGVSQPHSGGSGPGKSVALDMEDLKEGSFDFLKMFKLRDLVDPRRRYPLPKNGGLEDPSLDGRLDTWIKESVVWYQMRVTEKMGRGSVQMPDAEDRIAGTRASYFGEALEDEALLLASYAEEMVEMDKDLEESSKQFNEALKHNEAYRETLKKLCAENKTACEPPTGDNNPAACSNRDNYCAQYAALPAPGSGEGGATLDCSKIPKPSGCQ